MRFAAITDRLPLWLDPHWGAYVLDDQGDPEYGPMRREFNVVLPWSGEYLPNPVGRVINWLARFLCRWRLHPAGCIWFNPGGYEPDYRCKDCGQDLG